MLAEYFPNAQVQGFDFTEEGIAAAQVAHKDYLNLSFHLCDITKDNFGQFDLISMFEVLEHIEDWETVLASIAKKTNRYLFFSFPTGRMRSYEISGGHYRNFKKNEVEIFLDKLGFRPRDVWYAGFPFFSPIYRDACSFFPSSIRQELNRNISNKKISWLHPIMYFFARYLSTQKYLGEQFVGLFERVNNNI